MLSFRCILLYLSIIILIFNACSSKNRKGISEMELKAKTAAPEFSAPGTNDKNISLSSLKDSWVVLYFFPKAFTGG
ncbi:redoxin domain-containing protein [Candidatus Poribacteria bacterium]|nr:redoxin domain-containing protein [Candidatus Poribacteria bacterium]